MPTIVIYWSSGRTPEQKAAVVQGITETLVAQGGARREDVLVIFQNIEQGDAARGGIPTKPPLLGETQPDHSNSEHSPPVSGTA